MKAVILVGGEGTRMRPLTYTIPKAMLPVLNQPFLEHFFRYLKRHGVDEIILAVGYLPERIQTYFGDGSSFGLKLTYVVEDSPLGTAGGVKNAERYLDDLFFVFNGDIFTDIDLREMMSFHREKKAKVSIALTPVEDPSFYGVVETDAQGRVRRFVEKPRREEATTNLINAGIYIIDQEVLRDIPPQTHFMFEYHLFPKLLEKGVPIYGYPSSAYWIDMGTPQKYLKLHHDLLQGKSLSFTYDEEIKGAQNIIHPTAQIEGAVILGSRCIIGAEVRVRGPTVIGSDCQIHDGAVIDGALLWSHVLVGRRALLKDCIIGNNCLIGDGSHILHESVLADNVEVIQGSKLPPGTTAFPGTKVG